MSPRTRTPSEHGFTLMELLIAIAVMGIVFPALGGAFYVTTRTVGATSDLIGSSAGTSIVTSSFGPDVQSATSVTTSAVAGCPLPAGASALLTVARTDGTVTWFTTGRSLGRRACLGATTSTTTVELDTTAAAPALVCLPSCAGTPATVSVSFTPLEGQPISLRASRRNS